MRDRDIYVARLTRLPLIGPDGVAVGKIDDVVLAPSGPASGPRVLGFVASVQRRQIFVNAARVGEIDQDGVRLATGTLDVRRFHRRQGEILAKADVVDRRVGGEVVNDVGLRATPREFRAWEVATVSLGAAGILRRRAGRIVDWREVRHLFDAGPLARHLASFRDLHPADAASSISEMSADRRHELAEAMEDDQLADLLEELTEQEQVELIEGMDVERVAVVLEEMEPDDAADLLAELPAAEREQILGAMTPDEARPLRRLLAYGEKTAGGLMTPEPLIVGPDVTVAEALARLREPNVAVAIAAQVFVVEPPFETPTGRYVGEVGFQRLLREPPHRRVGDCIDEAYVPIAPDVPEAEVARLLAAYDTVAVPVCDAAGRLVGVVTVDDVLDHVLPEDWRRRREAPAS
ncbi:MAG TPA: CBS domain-containing protein [Acidimicrobiales bacterium]